MKGLEMRAAPGIQSLQGGERGTDGVGRGREGTKSTTSEGRTKNPGLHPK